ncbi:MAG: hypothetical protein F4148_16750 [Caldilineaceae bacterium SB0675_bin_29]|uniref:Uncharacterized protein n=1 Tax=Caldilineaceae bacterium SB0675_bin_29 TaxID=2605266 RepID=A0A6B1G1I9_9CHLR|nr:hypothetical protein [Caldilineaceae bacterium SB0675_bin_29]
MKSNMQLKIGYFVPFVGFMNRLGLNMRPHLWKVQLAAKLLPVAIDVGPSWVVKLLIAILEHVAKKSISDGDAQFALKMFQEVYGGVILVTRERVVGHMRREPDEEVEYYAPIACGNMKAMIYELPTGSRIWFNLLASTSVVGWGILQPGQDDSEMFWRRDLTQEEGTA